MATLPKRPAVRMPPRGPAGPAGPVNVPQVSGPILTFKDAFGLYTVQVNTLGPEGPSGSAQRFASISQAQASGISVGVQSIEIMGLTQPGDVGLPRYYSRASSMPAADGVQTLDGQWWQLLPNTVAQKATGHFSASAGAQINRLNDRVFIGAATVNDGLVPNVVIDYAEAAIPTGVAGGVITGTAQLASLSTIGGIGGLFSTRSSDSVDLSGQNALAIMALAINDNAAVPGVAFAGYFESQQKPGAGVTTGVEIDTVNQSGSAATRFSPYGSLADVSTPYAFGLFLGAGGARAGVHDNTAAIVVLANGAHWDRGIVFESSSVSSNEAIVLAKDHCVQWYGADGLPTFFVHCTTSGISNSQFGIGAIGNEIYIGQSPASANNSVGSLDVIGVTNGVNFLAALGGVTGAPAKLLAAGSDSNVDLVLGGKGAGGGVQFSPVQIASTANAGGVVKPGTYAGYFSTKINGSAVKIPYYLP